MSNRRYELPPEWLVKRAVEQAFHHCNWTKEYNPPGFNMFMSCCETIREGFILSIRIPQKETK